MWLSHFKGGLYLEKNEFTGTLPTEMGNMNQPSKLLCTHCLNYLIDFAFCMIICISMSRIYDLNMESVNWQNFLTTCKYCDFLIPKIGHSNVQEIGRASCNLSTDIQIIIQNTKSSKDLRQCMQNNLPGSFVFPISVWVFP